MKELKKCPKCGEKDGVVSFSKNRTRRDGLNVWCKSCCRSYSIENKQKIIEYRKENREKYNRGDKKYRDKNRDKLAKYKYDKRRSDLNYKIASNLRARLTSAIKTEAKGGSVVGDLGCSVEFLKTYLESLWSPGMSWDNWGLRGWHIDHKLPLSSFDLSDPSQFKKACNYINLQPLWAADNLKKSDKISEGEPRA